MNNRDKYSQDILQGLLAKYRALVLQLQDEILNGGPIGEASSSSSEVVSEKKVQEMQRDLAQLMLDKNAAEEDRNRIFEMMELLKAKYKSILDEKVTLNQELIQVWPPFSCLLWWFKRLCMKNCWHENI